MGCGCGGGAGRGGSTSDIIGFDYISPAGVSYFAANGAYLGTLQEARTEQRINGGGSIKTVRRT